MHLEGEKKVFRFEVSSTKEQEGTQIIEDSWKREEGGLNYLSKIKRKLKVCGEALTM